MAQVSSSISLPRIGSSRLRVNSERFIVVLVTSCDVSYPCSISSSTLDESLPRRDEASDEEVDVSNVQFDCKVDASFIFEFLPKKITFVVTKAFSTKVDRLSSRIRFSLFSASMRALYRWRDSTSWCR